MELFAFTNFDFVALSDLRLNLFKNYLSLFNLPWPIAF